MLQQIEDMALNCDGVDVVVISSGFEEPVKCMKDAIKKLDSKGVIVVCAAGNDGAEDSHNVNIKYPARYPQTICVWSTRSGWPSMWFFISWWNRRFCTRKRHHWSKSTPKDSNIYKYLRQGDGTSFATPAVGALICLILEAFEGHLQKGALQSDKRSQFYEKTFAKAIVATENVS